MNGTDVVVAGVGAVTPLAGDAAGTWAAIREGRTAVRHWEDLAAEGQPLDVACRVDDAFWSGAVPNPSGRGRALALRAVAEALADAGLAEDGILTDTVAPDRVGVFVGTTMGESAVYEQAVASGSFDLGLGGPQVFARSVAEHLGARGPCVTYGTACAAGNYAIGAAARAVASGRVDVALACGVEPFSRIAMLGFARMRAMAPEGCTPFGLARRGMTLGEGAAVLVLRRREDVAPADARAVVRALGLSGDAHHPTAPREDGVGMAAAMRSALERSDLSPADVGWVSAHGTGTPRSDAAESLAVRTVFGDRPPPVSSIKGAVGHTLGAATAVEAVVAVAALERGVVPPNAGVTEVDPALEVDVVLEARDAPDLRWVLSCGYAFGGLNSALVLGSAA